MKKVFAFILAIVYLSSTVGATIHLHYCMDKLVNWTLQEEGSKCKNCGMEKDGGCCKDENKFVKNTIDQSATGAIQLLQAPAISTHILFSTSTGNYFFTPGKEYPINHAPPSKTGVDILIHNSIFRI